MTHLLDTNVCIALMRGSEQVRRRLTAHAPTDIGVSTVTLYELFTGVERCRAPDHERGKIAVLVEPLHLLPFDADAAAHAAYLRWHLERKGKLIGPYDLQLAGQALALGVTLVTHNTAEFQRVPGLQLEDWQVCSVPPPPIT